VSIAPGGDRNREDLPVVLEVVAVCDAVLYSSWLLPVLVILIAIDGPFPVLPSETLLMTAAALAFGRHDVLAVVALFVAALVGSVAGDVLVFGLGRSSQQVLARAVEAEGGLSSWVRRRLLQRPAVVLVGARFMPGGRLLSTAAAGRFGLDVPRFLLGSVASSAAWSVYMLLIGLLLGPITGGSPLLSLLAGVVMAVLTAGAFALVQRVRAMRAAAAAPSGVGPALELVAPH
jgi:membrane-associated protein